MQRRTLLQLLGVTTVGATAGCVSSSEEEPSDQNPAEDSSSETMSETESATEESNAENDDGDAADDTGQCEDGLVTHVCEGTVEEAVDAITTSVEESPLTLMTTVDHAENAASVDEDLPPTTLLVFGNPEVGTPLMQDARTVAIDLPQKMLVWEDGDTLKITYNDPQYLAQRHGVEGQDERLEEIATVLEDLATGWV